MHNCGTFRIGLVVVVLLLPFIIYPSAATDVSSDLPLLEKVQEFQDVQFNLTIRNFPPNTDSIVIETDLLRVGNTPLFNFTNLGVVSYDNSIKLPVNKSVSTILLNISGKIPSVTKVQQYDKITLTTYDSKRTGYAYYRLKLLDKDGFTLGSGDTRTFEIVVPAIIQFNEKITKVNKEDVQMGTLIQDLFDKGMVSEANQIADHTIQKSEGITISLVWVIVLVLLVGIGGTIAGIRIGARSIEEDLGEEEH